MDKKLTNVKRAYSEEVVEDLAKETLPVDKEGVVVNCDALRVRDDHERDAHVITTILAGTKVTVKGDENNGFFNVLTPDSVFGWCMKEYIKML